MSEAFLLEEMFDIPVVKKRKASRSPQPKQKTESAVTEYGQSNKIHGSPEYLRLQEKAQNCQIDFIQIVEESLAAQKRMLARYNENFEQMKRIMSQQKSFLNVQQQEQEKKSRKINIKEKSLTKISKLFLSETSEIVEISDYDDEVSESFPCSGNKIQTRSQKKNKDIRK